QAGNGLADAECLRKVFAEASDTAVTDHPQPCLWVGATDRGEGGDRELRSFLLCEATDGQERGWRLSRRAGSEPIRVNAVGNVVRPLGASAEIQERPFHRPGIRDDRGRLFEQPRIASAVAIEKRARMCVDSVEVDDEREFEPLTGIHYLDREVPELDVDGLAARAAKCPDIQRRELGRLGVGAADTRDGTARKTSELCQR